MNFVTKHCRHFVQCHLMHLTVSLLRLYTCMLDEVKYVEKVFGQFLGRVAKSRAA